MSPKQSELDCQKNIAKEDISLRESRLLRLNKKLKFRFQKQAQISKSERP